MIQPALEYGADPNIYDRNMEVEEDEHETHETPFDSFMDSKCFNTTTIEKMSTPPCNINKLLDILLLFIKKGVNIEPGQLLYGIRSFLNIANEKYIFS